VPIATQTLEYSRIAKLIKLSLNDKAIISIKRIQNIHLWRRYALEKQFISTKNNGTPNELELFHGSPLNPEELYNSESGYEVNFVGTEGKWGQWNLFFR